MKSLHGHAGVAFALLLIAVTWLLLVATFDLPTKWLDRGCGIPTICAVIWMVVGIARYELKKIPRR